MPSSPASLLRALCLFALGLGLSAGVSRADLIWTQQGGWHVEGGALSGLTGRDGETALALMNKARAAEERHSYHSAIKNYEKVTKKYSSSIYAPEAFYRLAQIYMARQQLFDAFTAYQQIQSRYPNEKRFTEINHAEYHIASLLLDGAKNHLWGWLPLFRNRERCVSYLEQVYANAPYSDYAPLVLMSSARAGQYLGVPDAAIDELDRLINNYPQSALAPDAYLLIAQLHASLVQGPSYDQAETKQAITYEDDFMILFPNDPKIGDAAKDLDVRKKILAESKMKMGDFYFYKRDLYTAARVFYNEAITAYPDSDVAKDARVHLAAVEAKAAAAANPSAAPKKKKHFLFF